MQLQFARMEGLWPSDEDVSGFRAKAEKLMNQVQAYVPSLASFAPLAMLLGFHADEPQIVFLST